MKRLILLRHAKSNWDDPGLDDCNHPLNDKGWKAAPPLGEEMKRRGMHFDLVLASTAARVRETLDGVCEKVEFGCEIRFEPRPRWRLPNYPRAGAPSNPAAPKSCS